MFIDVIFAKECAIFAYYQIGEIMKALHRKIIHSVEQSFSHTTYKRLTMPLHYHEEFELILFTAGSGKEFIGDVVEEYSAGDLILIGSNVPHLHLCNSSTDKNVEEFSQCELLQFPDTIFPDNMENVYEYSFIYALLQKSYFGIKFRDKGLVDEVCKIMRGVDEKSDIERLMELFRILNTLGKRKDYLLISPSRCGIESFFGKKYEPVNRIYSYLVHHFKHEVHLNEISELIGLNSASVCRYFKQRTGKTIFECLIEIRIEHACRLLTHSNLDVLQIAYEVGYNNISNFNKQFKNITKQTPTEYREYLEQK